MTEKINSNQETDGLESEISEMKTQIQLELNELHNDVSSIDVPTIIAHRERLLEAIKNCDSEIIKFEANKPYLASQTLRKSYLDEIERVKGIIADQLEEAANLRQDFEKFCTFKKERIASQRQHIHDVLLPKAKDPEEKVALQSIQDELDRILSFYSGLSSFGNALYTDVSQIIQNKKAILNHRVIKDYPKKRYGESSTSINKESIAKAEDTAENGTKRSWKYAAQYLGGAPVMERGGCRLTDIAIKRNDEIMASTNKRIEEISESRGTATTAKRNENEAIVVPDLSEELLNGDEMIKNIRESMVTINVDTKYLDYASEQRK